MAKTDNETPWYITAGQIALVTIGLGGAVLHAFPIFMDPTIEQNWPVFDASDIAWLGLVLIAVLLPGITEITLGGASVKLREVKEEAQESFEELNETVESFANLIQNWSSSAMLYISLLGSAKDDDERELLLRHYLRDRMGEARSFLSEDPDDEVRIALWIYNPETDKVEYFFSNETPPIQQAYARGEGMIGQAFLERRRFNEPDVRTVPGYKKTREGDPPYRAVLCVPVYIGDQIIGMLTADKKDAVLFSTAADDIARGLASQCALAIDQFRKAG